MTRRTRAEHGESEESTAGLRCLNCPLHETFATEREIHSAKKKMWNLSGISQSLRQEESGLNLLLLKATFKNRLGSEI